MEVAAKDREARQYGQASLFEGGPGLSSSPMTLERLSEWPPAELLASEKENLGFFFSGHPLDPYRALITRQTNLDLSKKDGLAHDRACTIIGIFRDVREIRTKTGRAMAFAQIEDFRGSIECIVFSDAYERRRALVGNDKIVAVMGTIDSRRGEAKVKVDDVVEPKDLPQKAAQAIHIRLAEDVGTEESLHSMREYLLEHRGRCALFFHVGGGNGSEECIVQASSQVLVSDTDEVIARIRGYAQVRDAWKE
jgi:DNA polymerase-3 subunit alpha